MITAEIEFHAPRKIAEVLDLLATHADEAKLLGGGMSLMPTMNLGLARPEIVISLNHIAELVGIDETSDKLRIRAATTHADVLTDPLIAAHCPVLADAARVIGDVQVRNRGTIGGSIAHADPAADYLPVLVVLGATIVVRSAEAEREIAAADFFADIMFTTLEPNELITEIRVPKLPAGTRAAYQRLARVEGSFAIVNAAAVVTDGGTAAVAIGGIAGTPILIDLTEAVRGTSDDASLTAVADAVRAACPDPYEDLNGDAEYRREMAVIHARRAVAAALEGTR